MNANSKKLLSLLVVIAMVLSFVPVISLQANAAEEGYAFSGSPATVHCDGCNADIPLADWKPITTGGAQSITESGHYYLNAVIANATTNKIDVAADKVCLHLNGYTFTSSSQGGAYYAVKCTSGTLNIMGDGLLSSKTKATAAAAGAVVAAGGTVNIYGGKIENYHANSPSTIAVAVSGGAVNIHNATVDGKLYVASGSLAVYGGTFTVDPTTYVAEGYEATAGDSTWTVAAKATEPAFNAVCPVHGEVEWTALDAITGTSDWTHGSGHFYLTKDLTGTGKRVMQFIAADTVCLHLNGHSISSTCTTSSSMTVRSYGTLNIMGEGTISAGENTAAMGAVVAYGGTVSIYGGTYTDNTTNSPVRENGGTINVYGGTFCDNPQSFTTYECISQNAEAGTWTVEAQTHVFGEDGEAQYCTGCGAENPNYEAPEPVFNEVCAHCKKVPEGGWIEIDGNSTTGITADGHYYLTADWSKSSKAGIDLPAYNICLHLNGHSIEGTASNGRALTIDAGQTVNIMGNGTVTTKGTAGAIYLTSGTVNVYGGTYSGPEGTRVFHVNNEAAVLNVYGGTYTGTYNVPAGTLNIVGGTFSANPAAYIDEGKWAPALGINTYLVTDVAAAAVIANGTYTAYANAAAAVAAYTNGYILIGNTNSIELAGGNYYVDANGNSVTVTGSGTLNPVGKGVWRDMTGVTLAHDAINPITLKRYLTIGEGTAESYEFDMKLSQVVLRAGYGETAGEMGLFYKATIDTEQALADKIIAYGTVFSLTDIPGADVLEDETNLFTMFETPVVLGSNGKLTTNSGIVKGIFKTTNEAGTNTANGILPIFANAYVVIDLNEDGEEDYIMADTVNGGKTDAGTRHSLKDVLVAINGLAEVPELAKSFYAFWAEYGMDAWAAELPNLQTAAEETPAV